MPPLSETTVTGTPLEELGQVTYCSESTICSEATLVSDGGPTLTTEAEGITLTITPLSERT